MEANEASSPATLAAAMQSRLAALHAARRLAQIPFHGSDRGLELTVGEIIKAVIKPYENEKRTHFLITGADMEVGQDVATAFALIIYELCSNAVKYGSLSRAAGKVSITTRLEGPNFTIEWIKRGGPAIAQRPTESGFRTILTTATIEQQLGGSLRRNWSKDRFELNMSVPCAKLQREAGTPLTS